MLSDKLEQIKDDLASLAAAGQYCSLFSGKDEEDLDKDLLAKELMLIAKTAESLSEHAGNYLLAEECRKKKDHSALTGTFFMDDDTIRILVDGRIRRRTRTDHGKSSGIGYEAYHEAVFNLLSELGGEKYMRYREKVRISFVQHYAPDTPMLDADNMEVKPFIDAICLFLLDDDSVEQCSLSLDGIVDGRDFLEILIRPAAAKE